MWSGPYCDLYCHAVCTWKLCHFCSSWLNLINPRVLKIAVTNAVCTWRGWTLPLLRFECERMQLVYEIILLNTILRNHLLSENLQWNYGSFNVYPYLSHARSQNFAWHLLCLLTTEGKNIVKLLAISQTCQFQFFFTDLPRNFWKIAQLLGKIKNTITLRFISLYFLSKKSFSERTCPYWQWIVFTMKIKGQWPVPMVWKKNIHAVCGEDNIIIFQRENLNYLIVCFTQHTAVPCVFNAFDFYCRFVYRVLSVGRMKWLRI